MKTVYQQTLTRVLCLAAALCSVSLMLSAQDGSTAYNFLNVTSSARIYGLGGVNISTVYDDVMTTDQNPALLGQEMSGQVGLNYMSYMGGSNFAGARYARKAGEHGTWSAAIQYFGYGEIKGADESGNVTSSFSPKDMAISGSYSHDFTDRIRGGFAVKFLYSNYEQYTALALATDLGINYYNEESDLSLSAVVANLGGQIKRFDQRYDKLPVDVRLGLSKGLSSLPLTLSVTAWNLTKWKLPYYDAGDGTTDSKPVLKDKFMSNLFRHLVFAADLQPSEKFHIGLGYNYKTRTDMGTYHRSFVSGFSVCAGVKVKRMGVEVALAQPHTGATTLMLNLSVDLSKL